MHRSTGTDEEVDHWHDALADRHLLLVRHGETRANQQGLSQGVSDLPLNDDGRRQAHDLSSQLRELPLDVVLTSPLRRARQTAEIVAKPHGAAVQPIDCLRERDYGVFEGLSLDEVRSRRQHLGHPSPDPSLFWYQDIGAETDTVLYARVRHVVDVIAGLDTAMPVIVAHSGVLHVILDALLRLPDDFVARVRTTPGSATFLRYRYDAYQIYRLLSSSS